MATLAGLVLAGSGGAVVVLRSDGIELPVRAQPTPTAMPQPVRTPLLAALSSRSVPTPDGLALALAKALDDRGLGKSVSLSVVDARTGKVLLDLDADRQVTPASTAKIATAVAALLVLPPTKVFRTQVLKGSDGEVFLVGAGDPLLSKAQVEELANQLDGERISRVVVDDDLFVGDRMGPGWKRGYVQKGDVAPVSALSVDGGRRTDRAGTPRQRDPGLSAGRRLATLIGVRSAVRGEAPRKARSLAHVDSLPVSDLVERMLRTSDNDIAEALGRHVARAMGQEASFEGEAAGLAAALKRVGVSVDLRDASGLSPENRVSASALTRLLARVATDPRYGPVLTGLPVGGFDGTLSSRFRSKTTRIAAGQVRAKTGTLDGVSALAGFVRTQEGRLLAFDITADGVRFGATGVAQRALDRVATVLAECGCN